MSANWAYNLDMLAQNGVIDYDAPSFIMGQTPRYVGSPLPQTSPYIEVPNAPALKQPEIDEFKQEKQKVPQKQENDRSIVKNPSWKKWVFGALALGTVIFGACKFKSISTWIKKVPSKLSNKFKWSNVKNYCKQKGKSICNFFKNGWKKFIGLFKKP
jgi:hypothetical protein